MTKWLTLLAVLCLAITAPLAAREALELELFEEIGPQIVINQGLDPELAEWLEIYIKDTMEDKHSPAIAIGIVEGDKLIYQGYFGWANIEEETPVTPSTVFRIGSISKTFTAIGLMQQWEKGAFDMDDPVNDYTPYPLVIQKDKSCSPVTFRHMFTHTSGGGEFMSYRSLFQAEGSLFLAPGRERPPLSEIYKDGLRPRVCPGVKWAYCNFCYGGLGFVLEEISGETFEEYTQNRVLAPIGMNDSSFYENDQIMENVAQGYSYNYKKEKYTESYLWMIPVTPMGNMYSTVPDMGKYLIALVNNGANQEGKLVEPKTLEFMYETQYSLDERHGAMGVSFFKECSLMPTRVLGHGGAVPGFGSSMYFAPDKKLGVIVFGTVMAPPPGLIGAHAIKLLVEHKESDEVVEPESELWKGFEGYYGSPDPEFLSDLRFLSGTLGALRVVAVGDELIVTSLVGAPTRPLIQVSQDDPYFYQIDNEDAELPSYITFVPGDDDRAKSIIAGTNEFVRLEGMALARARMKAAYLVSMMMVPF